MKFKPTVKQLALRRYQEIYTSTYRLYCRRRLDSWDEGFETGAESICLAIGITETELKRIREIARKIVDYELEKKMQA